MNIQNSLSNDQFINQFSQAVYKFFYQILLKLKKNEHTIKNFQQELIDLFKSDYEQKFNNYLNKQSFNYQESYFSFCDIDSWQTKRDQSIKLLDYQQLVKNICKLVGRYVWSKDVVLKMLKQEQQVLIRIRQLVHDKSIENYRYAKSSTDVLNHHDLEKQIQQKGGGIDKYEIQKQLKSKYNTTFATPDSESDQESDQDDDQEESWTVSEAQIPDQEQTDQEETDQEQSDQEESDQEESDQEESDQEENDQEKNDQYSQNDQEDDSDNDSEYQSKKNNEDLNQENTKTLDNEVKNNKEQIVQLNNEKEGIIDNKKIDDVKEQQPQVEQQTNSEKKDEEPQHDDNNGYSSDEQEDEKQIQNITHDQKNNQKQKKKSNTPKQNTDDSSSDDESVNLPKIKNKNNKQVNTFWD